MANFENMTAEHYPVDSESPINNFSHCHIGLLHHFERLAELLHQLKDAEAASKIAQEALNLEKNLRAFNLGWTIQFSRNMHE